MKHPKKLSQDITALSNILLYILAIFACGALYSLFFIDFGFPDLAGYIPGSPVKTLFMMFFYAIPGIIMFAAVVSLIREGVKKSERGY